MKITKQDMLNLLDNIESHARKYYFSSPNSSKEEAFFKLVKETARMLHDALSETEFEEDKSKNQPNIKNI